MTVNYQLCKNIRENKMLRESFFDLAEAVYGLSFREWYSRGFWTARYQPYVITDGVKVMANASVNRIETVLNGEEKHLIQIGTVMTDPVYRNRGLSRWLMEEIIADWKEKCDGIYLYANDSVLGFTPKEQEHCGCERLEEDDDTLFVYREKENLFSSSKIRLPQLSHA